MLENDGAIYAIIVKLIQNVFSCPKCKLSTYGKENVGDHERVLLHNVVMERKFDWIVLLPRLLHFEMNTAKAFMELTGQFLWKICYRSGICKRKSPKIYQKRQ